MKLPSNVGIRVFFVAKIIYAMQSLAHVASVPQLSIVGTCKIYGLLYIPSASSLKLTSFAKFLSSKTSNK